MIFASKKSLVGKRGREARGLHVRLMKGQCGRWYAHSHWQKKGRTFLGFLSSLCHLQGDHLPRELRQRKVIRLSTWCPSLPHEYLSVGQTSPSSWQCWQIQVQGDINLSDIPIAHQNSFLILEFSQLQLSPSLPFARQWNDTSVGAPVKGAGTVLCILQTWKVFSGGARGAMKAFQPDTGKWGSAKLCLRLNRWFKTKNLQRIPSLLPEIELFGNSVCENLIYLEIAKDQSSEKAMLWTSFYSGVGRYDQFFTPNKPCVDKQD